MITNDIKEKVKKILTDHLEVKQLRKTAERFAILDEVYSIQGHFDIETLFVHMKNKKYQVSRATLYNTVEVLLECNLIIKHQFGKNQAMYEKAYMYRQHDHLICQDCEHVFEFCDPRLQQIQQMAGEILKFDIDRHSLTLYGKCQGIIKNGKCAHGFKPLK
ncbi:MAG TPA: transcriptional repressor [Bacteroidia bacterium]|jgi:Fur family ferric uptake transcriptional regulator|nr:transcriptional repressor [Bacteroidia bacterium]